MAITTARDLITESYRTSGIIGIDETPSNNEITAGLNHLHMLLESWDAEALWPYTKLVYKGQLVSGQESYTVGLEIGDDISIQRPDSIENFGIVIGGTFKPLSSVGMNDYQNSYRTTTDSSTPFYYVYYPDSPSSRIIIYPKPSTNYDFELQYNIKLTQYGLNDSLDLPSGYLAPILWGLAAVLCDVFGHNNPKVEMKARDFKATIKKMNVEPISLNYGNLPTGKARTWDVLSDGYKG